MVHFLLGHSVAIPALSSALPRNSWQLDLVSLISGALLRYSRHHLLLVELFLSYDSSADLMVVFGTQTAATSRIGLP